MVDSSFREAAMETTPVVAATAAKPTGLGGTPAPAAEPPGVLKAIYSLLRSYDPAVDVGVDMTNLYRVLEIADLAREATRDCVVSAPRSIAPPFPLGVDDTYTCAINNRQGEPANGAGVATRDDGTSHHALLAYRWIEAESTSLGVVQGHYDDVAGDVAIEMATVVRYPVATPGRGLGFGLRTSIVGNQLSHDFTLRALVRDVEETTGQDTVSIVGVGNSQTPGTSFLLRVTATGANVVPGRYFCVSAGADVTAVAAMDPAGTADPDPACAGLRAAVDALTSFVRDDAPNELTDFVGSDAYLPL
ncbi:MAG: hypothetical protein IPH80_02720 [Myxococcales bacterium]|nr:hypothetical protein [Myxococcales bacterium]